MSVCATAAAAAMRAIRAARVRVLLVPSHCSISRRAQHYSTTWFDSAQFVITLCRRQCLRTKAQSHHCDYDRFLPAGNLHYLEIVIRIRPRSAVFISRTQSSRAQHRCLRDTRRPLNLVTNGTSTVGIVEKELCYIGSGDFELGESYIGSLEVSLRSVDVADS